MTQEQLPAPPVPPDVDLTNMDGFVLNAVRLLGSELVVLSTGDEFKAAVLLWCRAWLNRPHASLPDNDKILASYAGMPLPKWRKVRDMALRGFQKCSDGRLYHPLLAADAVRSHERRTKRREQTKAATQARQGRQRHEERNDATNVQRNIGPNEERNVDRNEVPSPVQSVPVQSVAAATPPDEVRRRMDVGNRVLDLAGIDPVRWTGSFAIVGGWLEAGYDPEADIYPAIREVAARPGYKPPRSLGYFTSAIADARAKRASVPKAPDAKPKPRKPTLAEIKAEQDAAFERAQREWGETA